MELVKVQNGVANPRRRKRRKNPVKRATTATANPRKRRVKRRRNPVTAVTVANPRKRRVKRRRNPVAVTRKRNGVSRKRNGIFGDTKADAKNVLALVSGLVGTKIAGGIAAPYTAQALAVVGMGKFAKPVTDAVIAMTLTPMVAGMVAGGDVKKMARLGGLALAALDIVEILLPQGFAYNPFTSANVAPIVLQGQTAALVNAATQDVARAAIDAANNASAKIAGIMSADSGGNFAAVSSEIDGDF